MYIHSIGPKGQGLFNLPQFSSMKLLYMNIYNNQYKDILIYTIIII